jgi:hypothetical protein
MVAAVRAWRRVDSNAASARESKQSGSRPSKLAADRAEILRLIDELRRYRGRPRSQSRPAPSQPDDGEPPLSPAASLALLRSLEIRVRLLEERQLKASRKSSIPAPLGSPETNHYTFSGCIQGQMLSDMLQLVSSNAMHGRFIVEDGGQRATLYFEEGRVCHAVFGNLTGEKAFFAAFAFESGKYHFKETNEPPPEHTINSSTQFLILEALRQIDESHAE